MNGRYKTIMYGLLFVCCIGLLGVLATAAFVETRSRQQRRRARQAGGFEGSTSGADSDRRTGAGGQRGSGDRATGNRNDDVKYNN